MDSANRAAIGESASGLLPKSDGREITACRSEIGGGIAIDDLVQWDGDITHMVGRVNAVSAESLTVVWDDGVCGKYARTEKRLYRAFTRPTKAPTRNPFTAEAAAFAQNDTIAAERTDAMADN